MTVLVIACPHALGLAIPLVAQLSTAIGARRGILVRDRAALEQARDVDVVLFDKTGTLTEGRQGLAQLVAAPGQSEDDVLAPRGLRRGSLRASGRARHRGGGTGARS